MSEQDAIKKAARYMFENRTLELDSSPDEEDEWDNLPWQDEWIEGAEIALEGFRRAGLIPMPDSALDATVNGSIANYASPHQFGKTSAMVEALKEAGIDAVEITPSAEHKARIKAEALEEAAGALHASTEGQNRDGTKGWPERHRDIYSVAIGDAASALRDRAARLREFGGATVKAPFAIDADHLARQRAFSDKTFGPGARQAGVIDHIRKELVEIETAQSPEERLQEWVDVIILSFDGATRDGSTPQQVLNAVLEKQERNEARTWPDWRTQPAGKAIEHVRDAGEVQS